MNDDRPMTDAEFEAMVERIEPAFKEGFIAGRLGLPDSTALETRWGPVEGVRDGSTIRWSLPDHSWAELRLLADGTQEFYRNDRLAFRIGPVEIDEDDDEGRDA